jgi:hypothetical protein
MSLEEYSERDLVGDDWRQGLCILCTVGEQKKLSLKIHATCNASLSIVRLG